MNVRYRVDLNQEERDQLGAMLNGGKQAARRLKRAQILLAADAGERDETIAANVGVGLSTVYRTKRRFILGNLDAALSEEPRPGGGRKLTGKEEALLVATACSNPPQGRARWTLELLAGEMVQLAEHTSVSRRSRRLRDNRAATTTNIAATVPWVSGIGLRQEDCGTHSLRRTKASIIYKATGNLRSPDPVGPYQN